MIVEQLSLFDCSDDVARGSIKDYTIDRIDTYQAGAEGTYQEMPIRSSKSTLGRVAGKFYKKVLFPLLQYNQN